MENYIPYRILVINDCVDRDKKLEVLERCYRLAFGWANQMGLKGIRVFDLFFLEGDPCSVPYTRSEVWCKIECTEEQRLAHEKDWVDLVKGSCLREM